MTQENELVPEGFFSDIIDASRDKINQIKLNIFYSLIPKQKLKDAFIRLIESVETLVVEITKRTSLTVQDWVENNFDLIIERIASYVGLIQVPADVLRNQSVNMFGVNNDIDVAQPAYGQQSCFMATGQCQDYVPEVESPESIELIILVAQLLIPILRKWFS
jgi:hypothetical protein